MPSSRKTLELLTRIRTTDVVTDDLPVTLAGPLGELKSGLSSLGDQAFDTFIEEQTAKLGPTRPTKRLRTVAEARATGRESAVVRQRRQTLAARRPTPKRFTPQPFSVAEQPRRLEGGL